jgi:hypothetical protein
MVEGPTEKPRRQLIELLSAAWSGHRGSSHVVLESEILIVNPDRPRQSKRNLAHALPVPGHHGNAGRYSGQQLVVTKAWSIEDQHSADVHRGLGSIEIQE